MVCVRKSEITVHMRLFDATLWTERMENSFVGEGIKSVRYVKHATFPRKKSAKKGTCVCINEEKVVQFCVDSARVGLRLQM